MCLAMSDPSLHPSPAPIRRRSKQDRHLQSPLRLQGDANAQPSSHQHSADEGLQASPAQHRGPFQACLPASLCFPSLIEQLAGERDCSLEPASQSGMACSFGCTQKSPAAWGVCRACWELWESSPYLVGSGEHPSPPPHGKHLLDSNAI